MEKKGLSVGLLYLGLHNQLKKRFGVNGIISRKEFFAKIGRHYQIPTTTLKILVLREMEEKKLIKRLNRDMIQIMDIEVDLNGDEEKIYNLIGF